MFSDSRRRKGWIAALCAALLHGCAAPLDVPAVNLQANQPVLRQAAEAALDIAEESGGPNLHLSEKTSESIESLADDGTVSAYKVSYALTFQLDSDEPRTINLDQVVSVNESRLLAGRRARAEAVERLRFHALGRMRYILARLE